MRDWLNRLREWVRGIRARIRIAAVRRVQRRIEQYQRNIESAQRDLESRMMQWETEKDPVEKARLEDDAAAFKRSIRQNENRVSKLEERLRELDPDGSIRRSLSGG
jgi:hypothetical protein